MARQILTARNAHTYGVLDPLMVERRDTKFVQNSLSDGLNAIILPQGGYYDRGGSDHIAVIRFRTTTITLTAGMFVAPNGGTIANLIDGSLDTLFTTSAVSGTTFVLFEITFPAAENVTFVDLQKFSAAVAADAVLKVQYFDTTWKDMGPAQNVRLATTQAGVDISHSRRFGFAPATPPSQPWVTVTKVRAVIVGGAGPGAISIGQVYVRSQPATAAAPTGTPPDPAVARRYAYSADRFYTLILTAGNCDIYRKDVWLASCYMPSTGPIIRAIKHLPSDDTILFFHQDMQPWRIQRQGSDTEWHSDAAPFENIPLVDYGGTYTNGINEKQKITLYGVESGNNFTLTLEGEETEAIATGHNSAVAADVKSALEALPNVDPGVIVTGTGPITVEFAGGANAARPWTVMVGRADSVNGVVTVSRKVKGKRAGEDIMSATRGWPAVGRYVQQRLIMGGFKARPKSFLMSVTGEVYNLDSELVGATGARVYDIDDDDTNVIRDIHIARTIMFFLDGSVWAMEFQVLSAEDTPKLFRSDSPGITRELRPISVSNRLFYAQRGGRTLRTIVYSELEQNFLADNASVISASLFNKPIDSALRRGVKGNDADLLLLPLTNGDMISITLLVEQDVSGFMTHRTVGEFASLAVDPDETVWLIVQRTIDGIQRYCLERMEPDKLLDGALHFTLDPATAHITGLSQFNGQTVEVLGDGDYLGQYLVTGGIIDLPKAVSLVRVGTWIAPFAIDTPFHAEDFQKVPGPTPSVVRNFAVELSLLDTTSVAIGANSDIPRNVELRDYDVTAMDTALSVLPFTGSRRKEGLPGWTPHGQLVITQVFPGRLTVRSVTKEYAA